MEAWLEPVEKGMGYEKVKIEAPEKRQHFAG